MKSSTPDDLSRPHSDDAEGQPDNVRAAAMVSICLPDEVSALGGSDLAPRPIAVGTDEALPLVVPVAAGERRQGWRHAQDRR